MIRLSIILTVTLIIARVYPGHASNQYDLNNNLSTQPLAIQLAVTAIKSCMSQYLDNNKINSLDNKVHNAIKKVKSYCKNKDETGAYRTVLKHSKESEFIAARTCALQLKPIIESKDVQNALGKHKNDINIIINGGIPTPICR